MELRLDGLASKLRDRARGFALEELIPASVAADNVGDPRRCYVEDLMIRASELGFRTMKVPREHGGLGVDCRTEVAVIEEVCAGDIGFGLSLAHAWREGYTLAALASSAQRDHFLPGFLKDPSYVTSYAITESHFGSDASGASTDPKDGPRVRADERDGDWILNGQKLWITNASVARLAVVLARTNRSVPWREGVSWFLVPTDAPGCIIGSVEDKLGVRMSPNGEIVFDSCRLGDLHLLGEVDAGMEMHARMSRGARVKNAAKFVGAARACFEEAVADVEARLVPSSDGQVTGTSLTEMEIEIEAARSLMWRAACAVDDEAPDASRLEADAKVFAADVAARVAIAAVRTCSPEALRRGSRLEKLVRDAATLQVLGGAIPAMKVRLGERYT